MLKSENNNLMESLLKQYSPVALKPGDVVEGKVITQEQNRLYIDLGNLRTGLVYGREFLIAKSIIKELNPGDQISAKVVEPENQDGFVELSLAQAGIDNNWQKIIELFEKKTKIKVKIDEANRGGLMATVERQKAFLPVSQLTSEHYPRVEEANKDKILSELNKFVGTEMEVRVINADPSQGKLIISEKAAQDEILSQVISKYSVGDIVEGEISGVTDFGAFMKFKQDDVPLEGLIHISELDWQLIEDPRDVIKVGEKVKAKIIAIENGRFSLSLKALKTDSWEGIEGKYKKGDVVSGTLMKFNSFGAFIRLDENIHGLCHISEFGSEKEMKKIIEPEKTYKFKIMSLEPKEHRMSLAFADKKPESEEIKAEPEEPAAESDKTPDQE